MFSKKMPEIDPNSYDYSRINFVASSSALKIEDFIMLMNCPENRMSTFFPKYPNQQCSVQYSFFRCDYSNKSGMQRIKLCHPCYYEISSLSKRPDPSTIYDEDYYDALWHSKGLKFGSSSREIKVDTDCLLDFVFRNRSSWCDCCLLTPLFTLSNRAYRP